MTPHTTERKPLSVLVVDDDADSADSLAWVLSLHGFASRTAAGGPEALAAADADPPDAILLDLQMPGMSGWELARRLRERGADRRPLLIAVTGCDRDADRRRSTEAGIDAHLLKPVSPTLVVDLLSRFREVLYAPPRSFAGIG